MARDQEYPPFSGRLPDSQRGAELTAGRGALWSGALSLTGMDGLQASDQRKNIRQKKTKSLFYSSKAKIDHTDTI